MAEHKWFRAVEQIEDKAWAVLQEYSRQFSNIGESALNMPPVPVQDIAQLLVGLGLDAVYGLQREGQRLSGLLEPDYQLISYEAEEIPVRQTFSIAHELGHYYLHYLPQMQHSLQQMLFPLDSSIEGTSTKQKYYRCSTDDLALNNSNSGRSIKFNEDNLLQRLKAEEASARRETEANQFASALLMPVPLVKGLIKSGYRSVGQLAEQLGVSRSAIEVRLVRMGYLDKLSKDRRPEDASQQRFI